MQMSDHPDIENRESAQGEASQSEATQSEATQSEPTQSLSQETAPEHVDADQSTSVQSADQSAAKADHTVERTRTSGMWTAIAVAAVVLLLLLIFILQNLQSVTVSFLGFEGALPLGVGLLLAAVAGALVVVVTGVARIIQLRRLARRHRVQDSKAATTSPGA
jgi:uncharacterized integral membrane protein